MAHPVKVPQLRAVAEETAVRFYSKSSNPDAVVLSNFARTPFFLEGVKFRTAEHYFQWRKARLAMDEGTAARILAAETPREAKALGGPRRLKGLDSAKWNDARVDVMARALEAKFLQNPPALATLLATGERTLIEDSPWDSYWGRGAKGTGRNVLGGLLMDLCTRLRTPLTARGEQASSRRH